MARIPWPYFPWIVRADGVVRRPAAFVEALDGPGERDADGRLAERGEVRIAQPGTGVRRQPGQERVDQVQLVLGAVNSVTSVVALVTGDDGVEVYQKARGFSSPSYRNLGGYGKTAYQKVGGENGRDPGTYALTAQGVWLWRSTVPKSP